METLTFKGPMTKLARAAVLEVLKAHWPSGLVVDPAKTPAMGLDPTGDPWGNLSIYENLASYTQWTNPQGLRVPAEHVVRLTWNAKETEIKVPSRLVQDVISGIRAVGYLHEGVLESRLPKSGTASLVV